MTWTISSFNMSCANAYGGTEDHEESANWKDGLLRETTKGHDLVCRVRQQRSGGCRSLAGLAAFTAYIEWNEDRSVEERR